jgi:hypothetical protein
MTSSSKTMERLRNLMAKYDDPSPPHQAEHRPSRAKPTPAPRIKQLVRPAQIDREIRQVIKEKQENRPSRPQDGPMAAPGLTSYRYKGIYDWVMIGARDNEDALSEAQRSVHEKVTIGKLQVWNGNRYVPATSRKAATPPPRTTERISESRLPRELVWDTVEGVKVLVSEIPNYVAERTPNGSYSVIQLKTRMVIARGLRLKDVMLTIRKHHERIIEQQLREVERQQQSEAERQEELDNFENQPGFYIVPGETTGPDDVVHSATGPYWKFETLNPSAPPPEDNSQITDADVEEEACEMSRRLSLENSSVPVIIIEARNPREAAQGRGHVWWVEGSLKGPPVDPRQTGFGW